MPQSFPKYENPMDDKRRKIHPDDRQYIKQRWEDGESLRSLAREYGVTKGAIQYIVSPERRKKQKEAREKRGGWKRYYRKENHRKYMQRHRANKREKLNIPYTRKKII